MIDFDTEVFGDADLAYSAGVVTVGAGLDGARARVAWRIEGTGATNRVELRTELRVNGVVAKQANNYAARNSAQDRGGTAGEHWVTLAAGMTLDVRALRDGSNALNNPLGTSLSIEAWA